MRWQAQGKLESLKSDNGELHVLRRFAADVARNESTMRDVQREVNQLEKDLEVSGSTQTADDVQASLDTLARDLCVLSRLQQKPQPDVSHREKAKRDQRALESTRSDKAQSMQSADTDILNGEIALQRLRTNLSELVGLRQSCEEARAEIAANVAKLKVRQQCTWQRALKRTRRTATAA